MKNYMLFFLLSLFMISLASCDKDDLPKGLPDCVESKIEDLKDFDPNTRCDKASVIEYEFQGKTVYAVYDGSACVDGGTFIFDDQCEQLCFLGGIAGLTDCLDVNFNENATQIKVIWEEE